MSDSRVDAIMHDGPAAFGLSFNPNATVQTIHVSESWPIWLARPAETYGEWAVLEMGEDRYRVSHIPTGRCPAPLIPDLGLAVARLVAVRFAEAFAEHGTDLSTWTAEDGHIMEAIAAEELAR